MEMLSKPKGRRFPETIWLSDDNAENYVLKNHNVLIMFFLHLHPIEIV